MKVKGVSRGLMKRSERLLDMEYRLAEIAEELCATKERILKCIHAGAPARRDESGSYWIHGASFAQWLQDVAPKKEKAMKNIPDDVAYCTYCRTMKVFKTTKRIILGNSIAIVHGVCTEGHRIHRFVSRKGETLHEEV